MTRTAMALQTTGLNAFLGDRHVLHDIHLGLRQGVWTSIVGPNGAGKSTLLRALAGLLPCAGDISLLQRPLQQWSVRERACTVAWLGQGEHAANDLRVFDLVMLGRLPHRGWLSAPGAADFAAVEQALRSTQAWDWRQRSLGQLSGGERQRVLLARALAVQAPLLLMDEPLTNLDPPHQSDWLDTVRQLVGRGHTVVSVLHELGMALQADELVVMAQGRLCHHGPTAAEATHRALEQVFDQRLRIHPVQGHWVPLPVVRAEPTSPNPHF
jgi:iron complex transport system ATP-binding protein